MQTITKTRQLSRGESLLSPFLHHHTTHPSRAMILTLLSRFLRSLNFCGDYYAFRESPTKPLKKDRVTNTEREDPFVHCN